MKSHLVSRQINN